MSGRYQDFSKGSSRSTRDDSRHKERDKRQTRSRSRSPKQRVSPHGSKYSPERTRRDRDYYKDKGRHRSSSDSEEEVPAPPPPPRITKVSMGFSKPSGLIKMNIGGSTKPAARKPKALVASVFNDDDDDEPEEMPAEAKMRMRNIGRETPTSAGPNSFGKTKQGFCDSKKVFEKNLKQALETEEKPVMTKFPQTIYKIKGP